jgi:hypothetical protein
MDGCRAEHAFCVPVTAPVTAVTQAATRNVAPPSSRGDHQAKRIEYVLANRQAVLTVEVTKQRRDSVPSSSKSDFGKKRRAAEKPPFVF